MAVDAELVAFLTKLHVSEFQPLFPEGTTMLDLREMSIPSLVDLSIPKGHAARIICLAKSWKPGLSALEAVGQHIEQAHPNLNLSSVERSSSPTRNTPRRELIIEEKNIENLLPRKVTFAEREFGEKPVFRKTVEEEQRFGGDMGSLHGVGSAEPQYYFDPVLGELVPFTEEEDDTAQKVDELKAAEELRRQEEENRLAQQKAMALVEAEKILADAEKEQAEQERERQRQAEAAVQKAEAALRKAEEEQRMAAEQDMRMAEEQRLAEEQGWRMAEEQRLAEEQGRRMAEEQRLAEEQAVRMAQVEEARLQEEARQLRCAQQLRLMVWGAYQKDQDGAIADSLYAVVKAMKLCHGLTKQPTAETSPAKSPGVARWSRIRKSTFGTATEDSALREHIKVSDFEDRMHDINRRCNGVFMRVGQTLQDRLFEMRQSPAKPLNTNDRFYSDHHMSRAFRKIRRNFSWARDGPPGTPRTPRTPRSPSKLVQAVVLPMQAQARPVSRTRSGTSTMPASKPQPQAPAEEFGGAPVQTLPPAPMEGCLFKKGGGTSMLGRRNWNKRWLVLSGGTLVYYNSEKAPPKRGGERSQAMKTFSLDAKPAVNIATAVRLISAPKIDAPQRQVLEVDLPGTTPTTISLSCNSREEANMEQWKRAFEQHLLYYKSNRAKGKRDIT